MSDGDGTKATTDIPVNPAGELRRTLDAYKGARDEFNDRSGDARRSVRLIDAMGDHCDASEQHLPTILESLLALRIELAEARDAISSESEKVRHREAELLRCRTAENHAAATLDAIRAELRLPAGCPTVDVLNAVIARGSALAAAEARAARAEAFGRLTAHGLPFQLYAPDESRRRDHPKWWHDRLDGKWVVAVIDHDRCRLYLGCGGTLAEAVDDVDAAMRRNGKAPAPAAASGNGGGE
jgi:hypothetical protein